MIAVLAAAGGRGPARRPGQPRRQHGLSVAQRHLDLRLRQPGSRAEVGAFEMRREEVGAFEMRPAEVGAF